MPPRRHRQTAFISEAGRIGLIGLQDFVQYLTHYFSS